MRGSILCVVFCLAGCTQAPADQALHPSAAPGFIPISGVRGEASENGTLDNGPWVVKVNQTFQHTEKADVCPGAIVLPQDKGNTALDMAGATAANLTFSWTSDGPISSKLEIHLWAPYKKMELSKAGSSPLVWVLGEDELRAAQKATHMQAIRYCEGSLPAAETDMDLTIQVTGTITKE